MFRFIRKEIEMLILLSVSILSFNVKSSVFYYGNSEYESLESAKSSILSEGHAHLHPVSTTTDADRRVYSYLLIHQYYFYNSTHLNGLRWSGRNGPANTIDGVINNMLSLSAAACNAAPYYSPAIISVQRNGDFNYDSNALSITINRTKWANDCSGRDGTTSSSDVIKADFSSIQIVEKGFQSKKELGNPQSCIGNPISISTGNKYQQETLLAGALPLQLSYNSLDQRWRHNYSYRLNVNSDDATLIRPDGKGFTFSQSDSVWAAGDADVFYTLTALDNGAGSAWQVTTPDGSTELYDNEGQLLSITNLQGQTVNLVYAQNQIQIRDEFENILQLNVNADGQLTSASLNGIVQAQLNTDADGRLLSRTDAAGQTTTYHYEDTNFPKHLTGITGADGVRFATWAYDDQGRGILSEHAGQERATLVFNDDDSTTVTNSLGKQTTYRFELIQGLKRPVAIEGHATESCVAANKAYTYHANGLVETQTDWSGNVTRFEYNDRGLIIRRVEAEGTPQQRETLTTWHTELPLRVEQIVAGEKTTYRYDGQNRLSGTETLAAE